MATRPGPYTLATLRGKRVAFLARHGDGHRLMPSELNFRANIFGFKMLGVEAIISASAVGSLREELRPLDLVFPDQFIDRTFNRTRHVFRQRDRRPRRLCASGLRSLLRLIDGVGGREGRAPRVHAAAPTCAWKGPQFSTLAESNLYRSWGAHVIGMTNLQEAKLAREAEICYTTMALVTDYDCWHPDHDSVTVEMIIQNLTQNAKTAQQVIAAAVERYAGRQRLPMRRAPWRRAIITRREAIPDAVKRDLAPIIGKYVPMKLVVTGSIAFDYLMSFPGKFTEHLLPEHMHRVSLSFLVDTMDKRRGGCAPNIAYTLALLGERPLLMATAGQDFGDYRAWLEAAGIDTSHVKVVDGKFTASFFCSTDQANNQIASFYTGAMANAGELSFRTVPGLKGDGLVIISPNDPDAMVQYAQECSTLGIRYIWDPGQQCARMDGTAAGRRRDRGLHGDRERLRVRAAPTEDRHGRGGVQRQVEVLVITRGEKGCPVMSEGRPRRRARSAAGAHRRSDRRGRCVPRRIHERAGHGASYEVCARMGSVAATYALEHLGRHEPRLFAWTNSTARYEEHFGPLRRGGSRRLR